MHGLLYNVKSNSEKYDGADIQLRMKIFFRDSDNEWPDNISNAFFENNYKKGTPEEVKCQCENVDSKLIDRFYRNLSKLAESKIIFDIGARMDVGAFHEFTDEGIKITCEAEITQ